MRHSFLLNILWRIVLITLVAAVLGWASFSAYFLLCVILGPLLIVQIANLIHYQNHVNERISYFFEAIKNEDFSQAFPAKEGEKIIRELNENLKKVNQYIQQIKIDSHRQEQYFRALIEHVGTGILTYDEKGFVLHANASLKKLLGMEQFTHLKQLERIDQQLANALRQIQQQEQKLITFNSKHGQINLLIKATEFKSQDQHLTLLSVQDINQELDEKELDSWLKLIRVLTHEIMNSIAPVTSLSESLSNYYFKDGKRIPAKEVSDKIIQNTIRGLEIIKEQGKGLIHFVELYRKFTRIPKPEKKLVGVKDLLEKSVFLSKVGFSEAQVSYLIRMADPDLQVLADENLISQVLNNLLKNSVEALSGKDHGELALSAFRNGLNQVEISVRDNGPGIPPELINEIFVPFFTTRESGNGIGLSLSRQIMRVHGGSLKVHSTPGKETVFTLTFN